MKPGAGGPGIREPLARERRLILAILLVVAVAAWAVLLRQANGMDSSLGANRLTMGMRGSLFLTVWVVMMVAMMFPAAAPMILMFDRIAAGKRAQGRAFVPTWTFVVTYLAVWALFGGLLYAAAMGADRLARHSMWLMDHVGQAGGALLVVAGLYQLSPLKRACLAKCRSPLAFIMGEWRDGYGGAVRLGLLHAAYCLGCCWLLFVILFPLGIMNIAAMAVLTLLIYAEKALPLGERIVQLAGLGLVIYGILVMIDPSLLPVMQTMQTM
jgi:predicted metal-binding membrane protein